ncbi:MAG: Rid family detoxifying hydrolase [Spirochaetales bacterium]|nr:Rid family detoxifying hydrolase [Candidatus Physcosoma equi]
MIKAVLFDFDGTIADSSEGIFSCALKTVEKLGYNPADYTMDYMRRFIGPPLTDCFRITFGVPEDKVKWCVEEYRIHYNASGMFMMHPYEGIEDALKNLRKLGYKTAVATNKMKELAERCVKNLGIDQLFDYVSGPESDGGMTKADVIKKAYTSLGLEKDEVLMVGDTTNDMKGAETCGVRFCGVTWGFGFTKESLEGHLTAETPCDIITFVEELNKKERTMIERVNTPNAPAAIGPYSQAVKAGGFVFVSGMLAIDPQTGNLVGETAAEQAAQCFKNISAVLTEAGSSINKVVKAIVYLENIADFAAVNEVYAEAFKGASVLPARCAFQVVKLPKGGKIEIEVTALA